MLMAILLTLEAGPPGISDGAWAAIGVIATAILGFFGALLLHTRTRYASMEAEIQRLRRYSWIKNEQDRKDKEWSEDKLETLERYVDDLQDFIRSGQKPPPPARPYIPRPRLSEVEISVDTSDRELKQEINKIIDETPGKDTGPLPIHH